MRGPGSVPLFGGDSKGCFAVLHFGRLLHAIRVLRLRRRGVRSLWFGRPQHGRKPAGPGKKLLGGLRHVRLLHVRDAAGGVPVLAQVVAVGCDVPPGAHLEDGVIVPEDVPSPMEECFAPVTTVAVAGVLNLQ